MTLKTDKSSCSGNCQCYGDATRLLADAVIKSYIKIEHLDDNFYCCHCGMPMRPLRGVDHKEGCMVLLANDVINRDHKKNEVVE